MKTILIIGSIIVTLALVFYSIGVLKEQMSRRISRTVLAFLTAGVCFDVTSTACMIAGSTRSPFTAHGILGYSALAAMTLDTWLLWKFYKSNAGAAPVPPRLHLYSRTAYLWWIFAYISGAVLVTMR